MPTRAELQQLAEQRLAESKLLLDHGHSPGAYYVAGYAVECGLKACIAALMKSDEFPEKTFARECYTHEIEKLVALAQLKAVRDSDALNDVDMSANWGVVKDWNEESRYLLKDQAAAQALYDAVSDSAHGVFQWIKARW